MGTYTSSGTYQVNFTINDDNVALENDEIITLNLGLSSPSSALIQLGDQSTTNVSITDDDGRPL